MSVDERVGQDSTGHAAVVRARWRRAGAAVLLVAIAVGVGVVLARVLPRSGSGGAVAPWRHDLSGALTAVAIAMVAVGVVMLISGWTRTVDYRAQASRFSREQRRRAQRCVRRGHAAPPEVREAATLLARASARQARTAPLYVGIVANVLSTTISETSTARIVVGVVFAVVIAVAVLAQLAASLGARRWLRTYAPTSPASAESLVQAAPHGEVASHVHGFDTSGGETRLAGDTPTV